LEDGCTLGSEKFSLMLTDMQPTLFADDIVNLYDGQPALIGELLYVVAAEPLPDLVVSKGGAQLFIPG